VEQEVGPGMGRGEYAGDSPNDIRLRASDLEDLIRNLSENAPASTMDTQDLGVQIDDLTKRVEKTEARGSDEVFEMDQFLFSLYSDFEQMVFDEKVLMSGVFWDLFSVLVSMRPKGLSGKERVDEQYSSERIKTTMFENNLLAAMSHSRPTCLYAKGGFGALVGLEEGFGACVSHSQWISGVESVKKILGKQLKDFTTEVLGNMPKGAGGNSLAKALLAEVKAQWYDFVSWIDEFYKQLTEEANFKENQLGDLSGDVLPQFSTLWRKREPKCR
jgi:hypothetical protein